MALPSVSIFNFQVKQPSPSILKGVRILITRPIGEGQEEWHSAFSHHGAISIFYPTIEIQPPATWDPVDQAIAILGSFHWLVFTSTTAVRFFVARIPSHSLAHAPLIAAVGSKTAESIGQSGGRCELVASDPRQEGLLDLLKHLAPKTRILIPQAEQGRPLLAQVLQEQQCEVRVVPVYRTVFIADLPKVPEFDVAVFASPSAFQAFIEQNGGASLHGKAIVAIGPTTAKIIRSKGLVPLVPSKPTIDVLVETVALSWQQQGER